MQVHAPAALSLRHLRHMLLADSEAMEQALQDYMTALLEAATALQYESVEEIGAQLGVNAPPAPFFLASAAAV